MKKIFWTVAVITFVMSNITYAKDIDLQKFINETQKMSQDQQSFRLVWWIPTEYWEETLKNDPNMNQNQKDTLYESVNDYVVLAIIDAGITALGSIVPVPKEKIVDNLSLSIGKDKRMLPLADTDLNSDAKNLFSIMKPLMGNMLGQFGQGIEFVCFQGTDYNGKRLLNPKNKGAFTINYSEHSYKWRLPLGSLLPAKFDKETEEEFPGNYIYSPYTGNKLIEK